MPRVLVVDDVDDNRCLLETLLTGTGFEVVTARNGEEALREAERTSFDLAISDILMPVMDGFTLCRRWQQDPRLRPVPFVFYTATYTDPKDEQLGLSLGAAQFIIKPIEPIALLGVISGLLAQPRPEAAAAPPPPSEAEYVKQHEAALTRKLDDKVFQLEGARTALALEERERHRLQAAMERAQRLEALSLFSSGIAHDFNNLLTGIYGSIELAAAELPSDSHARAHLERAMQVFEHARELTGHLLAFARGFPSRKAQVDVRQLLDECLALCLSGAAIQAEVTAAPDLPQVEANATLLSQVLNNVILNARQAMGDRGRLHLSLGRAPQDGSRPPNLAAGEHVQLAFRDEGPGIAPEHLKRLFEPFFTTKPAGSGLGLATSRSIVESFGGRIQLASKPGEGTTVTVWLPAAAGKVAPAPRPPSPSAGRGAGRVLIMDDELNVRETTKLLLGLCGYDVVAAANGAQALQLFRQAKGDGRAFDVVILDLTVRGGMGGEETAAALRAVAPEAVLVLSTGYGDESLRARALRSGFNAVIAKPFRAHELQSAIEALIARPDRFEPPDRSANG